jgi:predicted nuclease of predicted toxin-antitoxin system
VRFLIDNAVSPVVGEDLKRAGHDAVHVRELGLEAASDQEIFDHAAHDGRVIVSADTDFGTLLALRKQTSPSVILFRHGSQHRPADQATLLKVNLPQLADALETGSIVVMEPERIRIRTLPLVP